MHSNVQIKPPLLSHPTPRDHDLNKPESTLPEDATTRVLAFLPIGF